MRACAPGVREHAEGGVLVPKQRYPAASLVNYT